MKYLPVGILFLMLVLICLGALTAATYLEFFKDPPLPKGGKESPVAGLWGLGVLAGGLAGLLGFAIAEKMERE